MKPIRSGRGRYAASIAVRLTKAGLASASGIIAITVAQLWGDWRLVAIELAIVAVLVVFNLWVTFGLLRRSKIRFAETVRTCGNLCGMFLSTLLIGFPSGMWLWIPFAALTFDNVNPRSAALIVGGFVIAMDAVALHHGAPWIEPVMFNMIGAISLLISRARFATIRHMLSTSDEQRAELAEANAVVAAAHARLVEEVHAREQVEVELRQAQKLEAIGRLASGIAHEINTPVQFVSDSVQFVGEATRDLLRLAARARTTMQGLEAGTPVPEALAALRRAAEEADLTYVTAELPGAIARALDGLDRIATIVRSMKEFAHPDVKDAVPADLNRALLATITITANEHKQVADIDFVPGELPPVTCRPGELNQVFLNLIVNAAHAIGDLVRGSGQKGTIAIRTRRDGDHAVISIADTGGGIPEAIRTRVFDPFFTTKAVGRGTGQGLAIARNVVKQHGGTLTFESAVGRGTTFVLRLPLDGVPAAAPPRISTRSTGSRPPMPAG